MNIGYARVSTKGQSLGIQVDKLRQYGCVGVHTELDVVLEAVRVGDVLVVTRLEHLAQSLYQLAQVIRRLDQLQVGLVVLDQGLDSTRSGMYQTVLAVAEFDRSLVNERIVAGVAKAKAAGVKFGRTDKLTAAELQSLRQEFNTPGVNKAELAKKYGLHRSSLYRLAQEEKG